MKFIYDDNSKEFTGRLSKHAGYLAVVCSRTVNEAANFVGEEYKNLLKTNFKLRNERFTLGAVKVLESAAYSSSRKKYQTVEEINAFVGVRNMAGGADHYLKTQEFGDTREGSSKTDKRVPVPLLASRGGQDMSPVVKKYRLSGSPPVRFPFEKRLSGLAGPRRWAALINYAGKNNIDLGKPFIYWDNNGRRGVFIAEGNKPAPAAGKKTVKNKTAFKSVRMLRSLKSDKVQIKARHYLKIATVRLTDTRMNAFFKNNAKKFIR